MSSGRDGGGRDGGGRDGGAGGGVEPARENLTYEQFGTAVRELAQAVADDGYVPDVILSIARGGVFVAGGLAYALDCKNIHLVNVEYFGLAA